MKGEFPTRGRPTPADFVTAAMPHGPSVLRELLRRPIQLLTMLFGLALLVALGLLVAISWRGMLRLDPFSQDLKQQATLQAISRALQDLLPGKSNIANLRGVNEVRRRLAHLVRTGEFYDRTVPARLNALRNALDRDPVTPARIEAARTQIADALAREMVARQLALATFKRDAKTELLLAVAALLVLPGTAILVVVVLRERFIRPLRDLNHLLSLISEGHPRPAPIRDVGTPLRPVLESYNRLVEQLATALKKNRQYQAGLENEVRAAARVLICQQREIAEADRLAAVGEISARVAHELKNPLAGIRMALANLKEETESADQRERFDLVGEEVARIGRLLNQLLVRPNREAEPCQKIEVCRVVSDLFALLRYQVPAGVCLRNKVEAATQAWLERDTLRQILLNLVLNSAQALGEAGGTIEVAAVEEGHTLRLSVVDDGPGFPLEILKHGAQPFRTTRKGGMGLGLPTVQRMARAIGGRLVLGNRQPKGAVATLLLDIRRPA